MASSSFRPIAPAQPMHVYAASCNPPRRAKRARSCEPVSPLSSPSQPDEPPKRRGRRPGTLSRAAREAQRKVNHSLIEKARRTKINDALATLRELVPPAESPDDSDDDEPRHKPRAEKEFKLEILVRTVAHLQELTDRVRQLEHGGCPRCSEPISHPKKRRCDSPPAAPHTLPSISAWLPSSVEDQRSLLLTPSHSPVFDTSARPTQLPTPPASAICAPATAGFPLPPVLTLPSPSTLLPTTHMQPRFSGFTTRAKPSPVASPVYTPDDETAASLLLRMSARPVEDAEYALTPSRLLGLSAER